MLMHRHPDIRVARQAIGREGAPLLIIDNLLADPERMVRKAATRQYVNLGPRLAGIGEVVEGREDPRMCQSVQAWHIQRLPIDQGDQRVA